MRPYLLVGCTLSLTLVSGLAFAGGPETSASDELDGSSQPIYGGENSLTCAWPSTVSLGGCTGTLVHPEVVIYAAHCGAGPSQVYLGERSGEQQAARTIATEYCRINPDYSALGQGSGTDHAYCKLAEPVYDVPIVPILMGCETSVLSPGREVAVVGFGQADIEPASGAKSEVYTTINGIIGDEASIGGDGEDACFGDSGGPVFVRLPTESGADGSWRVFGIVSYGAQDCLGPSRYSMMHVGMPWFEGELAAEGIDLTPCHDSEGNWEPTPQCQDFPMDPGTPYGSWGNGCSEGAPLSGVSEICGPGFEPELDPPTVSLTAPEDGATFETLGADNVTVTFTAEAMDEGSGIKEVRLQVDGEDIYKGADSLEPYEWVLNLPPGGYVLNALAVDWSNNETLSNTVTVGVDEPAPEAPSEDDDDDETAGEGGGLVDNDGCNCAAADPSEGPRRGFAGLALLGLLALRRRRRPS